jgi:hypothetical protein
MLVRGQQADGSDRWSSPFGQLTARHPAPGVVVFVETGSLDIRFAALIVSHSDRALEEARSVEVFVDCYGLLGYDPEVRNAASAWLRRNASRVIAQHMLVRSRFTTMGLKVVSLAFGGLTLGHHDRTSFDAELAQSLRRARSIPSPVELHG